MITWEWLKHKKLVDISLKKRWEKDIMGSLYNEIAHLKN